MWLLFSLHFLLLHSVHPSLIFFFLPIFQFPLFCPFLHSVPLSFYTLHFISLLSSLPFYFLSRFPHFFSPFFHSFFPTVRPPFPLSSPPLHLTTSTVAAVCCWNTVRGTKGREGGRNRKIYQWLGSDKVFEGVRQGRRYERFNLPRPQRITPSVNSPPEPHCDFTYTRGMKQLPTLDYLCVCRCRCVFI